MKSFFKNEQIYFICHLLSVRNMLLSLFSQPNNDGRNVQNVFSESNLFSQNVRSLNQTRL